jgi:hypothetical protein
VTTTMTAIDEAARLLSAASRTPDRRTRAIYLAEARITLDTAGERIGELRLLLDAAELELARIASLKEET